MSEGWAGDVTAHPATRAMVEEYAAWYDRHLDPAWEEVLLAPADAGGKRVPWAYVAPKGVEDLIGMGRSFAKTTFSSAGNITDTPAYGNLIALGVLTAVQSRNVSQRQVAEAMAYRDLIARTGRFLTFCGGAPIIGQRMRPDPRDRVALQLVRESDAGVVIRGKVGTGHDPGLCRGRLYWRPLRHRDRRASRKPYRAGQCGRVITLCRKIAARDSNPFVSPLSSRYDELDGQMWLDDVFIPW